MKNAYKLNDYKILEYLIKHIDLELDLSQKPVHSKATLTIIPNPALKKHSTELTLDGEYMILKSVCLNGQMLESHQYVLTEHSLTIKNIPSTSSFTLETSTILSEQTDLFGLYETEGIIIVKAETEGLRRVLFCQDRPDNLATYKTRIIAKANDYPILLSNGLLIDQTELPNGLIANTWLDNLPKPSYLFALVAGSLQRSETVFKTRSGRDLPIIFYVPPNATAKCDFAKEVLKAAMAWDEHTYNLECDLPQHMVAGVDKYASGASEPTGLNLFNTANLFARPESTTDLGFLRVMEVVAHEFFHYWSGDRVTIRDWFNLPLKEGLTTFRAAMFREDLFGTDLVRLLDGKNLDERAPRQSSYTAVRSLYTEAAYEKSADIFRMMMIYMGKETFYRSMTEFLKKNDGSAVTLEEMLGSINTSSGINLDSFLLWFTEQGIPELEVSDEYHNNTKEYTLKVKCNNAKLRPIPLLIGLLDQSGIQLITDTLLMVTQPEMVFHFTNILSRPVPSLLRSFSAPVHLHYAYTNDELMLLIKHDTNIYNRCEASRQLIIRMIERFCFGKPMNCSAQFYDTYRSVLFDKSLTYWLLAELLSIPNEEELIASITKPDFKKIAEGRAIIITALANQLKNDLVQMYDGLNALSATKQPQFTHFDITDAGIRRLKAVLTSYMQLINPEQTRKQQIQLYRRSLNINMTDTLSALSVLCYMDCPEANELLSDFYEHWKEDNNALNYWFALQAASHSSSVVARVASLINHPAFDITNPNKIYALLRTFIKNPYGFHALSGEGYSLVANVIITMDKINPAVAANLAEGFISWNTQEEPRQQLMLANLKRIAENSTSVDVNNMINRGLFPDLSTKSFF